jgi:hypothetical protein
MFSDPDLLPEEQVEQDERRELLLEVIEMLPSPARSVVLLRYTHQLSFREIGQELGIPDSMAKTYFHWARKSLRTRLAPEYADEVQYDASFLTIVQAMKLTQLREPQAIENRSSLEEKGVRREEKTGR